MNTPLSWIKAYVPDLDVTPQEYTDAMTLSGTKVEGYECLDADLDKIIVGRIEKIERHPDADKLVVCQVQINEEGETVQIVTGAPNVFEGAVIPVVLDGGKVAGGHDGSKTPGGIKIKKGKLRGIESNGMMCSIEELGSSKDMYPEAPEEGIYIFNEVPEYADLKLGSDAIAALGLRDTVFEYEITSNRVDCFGVLGIAREAAATFRKEFVPPQVAEAGKVYQSKKASDDQSSDYIKVEVRDTDLCPRYVARIVKNIRLAPSPMWMQRRLAACGIRPINNLVDITNYVMEEYSQPMHAYDLSTIAGDPADGANGCEHKIIVERAKDGEVFQTLDGQERKLDSSMLLIRDGEKAVGIAGIMGGENSKITDEVKTMLFEAACFNGTNIRLSGKKLGMRTDAAAKFEKGLDPNTAMEAMNRACQLIEELDAGDVIEGCVDVYPEERKPIQVKFDLDACNRLLGTDISMEQTREYFGRLELELNEEGNLVTVPTWRQDVLRNADLAEEIARFYGYDNIPTTLPTGEATTGGLSFKLRIEEIARNVAEQYGFCEGMNYSFESPKVFEKLCIPEGDEMRQAVTILNPLGEDYSIMRTMSLNGILNSLSTNYNRRNKNVRLFELANIYLPKALPLTELPEERIQFTLGFYGDGDFFDMKGVVEEFLEQAGLKSRLTCDAASGKPFLHPGRQANLVYEGAVIGYLGEVHPQVLDNYSIGEKAYIAVIDMPQVVERASFEIKYEGIARYPAMSRDISMVMKKEITAGQIEEILRKKGGKLLESCYLFDIYEGAQIKSGYKSMAYSVTFRNKERTLEDKEVNTVMEKILKALEEIGVELRK
ncbi:MAG: phenylalanine--tRNA ligase subunit beta [Lachnospiraceae bacterium]|jgi:phenylalanyl-tRNA synthetase beta chain|nr:phenylalanine--tRNA ligase subunit beta [Lachnospiraceae bacterium]